MNTSTNKFPRSATNFKRLVGNNILPFTLTFLSAPCRALQTSAPRRLVAASCIYLFLFVRCFSRCPFPLPRRRCVRAVRRWRPRVAAFASLRFVRCQVHPGRTGRRMLLLVLVLLAIGSCRFVVCSMSLLPGLRQHTVVALRGSARLGSALAQPHRRTRPRRCTARSPHAATVHSLTRSSNEDHKGHNDDDDDSSSRTTGSSAR